MNRGLTNLQYSGIFSAWAFVWVSSLLLKSGLSPALQGAFVGAGPWISFTDHSGNFFSQAAAVSTSTMLIVFALGSLRIGSGLILRLATAVLASLPTVILIIAQRAALPSFVTSLAVASAGLVLVLSTLHVALRPGVRFVFLLCGFSVILDALAQNYFKGTFNNALLMVSQQLSWTFSSLAVGVAFFIFHRRTPLKAALVLGAGSLLALISANAALISSPLPLLLARGVDEMALNRTGDHSLNWQFSIVMVMMLSNLHVWRNSPCLLLLLNALLASHAQLTPLTSSIIALSGIALLAVCGIDSLPQDDQVFSSNFDPQANRVS